jgi:hypothetical protein
VRCLKLPFSFDSERLRSELSLVQPDEWIPHQNKRHYDGQWSGAALRSIGGAKDNLVPDASTIDAFQATPLLGRCRYFQDVLATFRCPLQSVRLLRLHAGSSIAEHVDHALDFEDGEVRLHIPIVTNDAVRFYVDAARVIMAPGECWYTNVNLPHSVENGSTTDRIHLVLDCRVDSWLRDLFLSTPKPADGAFTGELHAATVPETPLLIELLSEFARQRADTPKFRCDRNTYILEWRERHAWQIRLKPEMAGTDWAAKLETSPDPERRRAAAVSDLVAALRTRVPGLELRPSLA